MKVKKDYIWYGVTAFLIALVVVAWVKPTHYGQISPQEAGDIVKELYSSAYQGMDFKVENVTDKGGVYEVTLSVEFNGQKQTIRSGVTKDGKYFMPTLLPVDELKEKITANNQQQQPKFEPNKTAKPKVELFVMPFCPFGQPSENSMYPVAKLFGDKISYTIHYIINVNTESEWNNYLNQIKDYLEKQGVSEDRIEQYINSKNASALVIEFNGTKYYVDSLHGKNEAMEAIRQMCIWKYYPNKVLDYIWNVNHNCTLQNINTCWANVASNLGIDTDKIEQCYSEEGVSLALNEQRIDEKYGVTASPTLFVNGVIWPGERTSAAYQSAICQSFTNEPAECNEIVNETTADSSAGVCST